MTRRVATVRLVEPFDSPSEAAFRTEVRAWLAANATAYSEAPVAASAIVAEWSPDEESRRLADAQAWQATKFDAGWAGISWPTVYGGRGGTFMEQVIFAQEEALFDVPHDALIVGLGWCGPAVMAHGTTAHRQMLRPLLRGEDVWCQLFSEPGAGSDLAGLATRAVRDGEEWRLSGQKVWTTFAHRSTWGLCIARHDPNVPKHRGLTAYIVDMTADGLTCRPVRQMTGAANFNEVFLDGVRVPDHQRLGEVGDGWRVVVTTFMFERLNASFVAAGALEALGDLVAEGAIPALRARYVVTYAKARAVGFTILRLLTGLSQGRVPGPEGSIVKLAGTTVLSEAYELAVDLLGPAGVATVSGVGRAAEWSGAFLGAPGLRIGGGTDQIQRNIIGERVLALPGDVRVDKEIPFNEVAAGV